MRIAPIALFAAAVLAPTAQVPAGAPAAPQATDQSTADLRQEIDRLRRQLADSQAELDAAKARIKELESDYRAMGQMIFGAPPAFGELMQTLAELERTVNAMRAPRDPAKRG